MEELHELMFQAMAQTTTPPASICESPRWQKFLKKLNPAFVMPDRKAMGGRYLEQEFKCLKVSKFTLDYGFVAVLFVSSILVTSCSLFQIAVEDLVSKAPSVAIGSDGWSDIKNVGIVNVIVFPSGGPALLWESIDTGTNSHTGQYYCDELSKAIDKLGPEKVMALVTDNASNMKLGWELLQQRYQWLLCYGCLAHSLNLLARELCGYFKRLFAETTQVTFTLQVNANAMLFC